MPFLRLLVTFFAGTLFSRPSGDRASGFGTLRQGSNPVLLTEA